MLPQDWCLSSTGHEQSGVKLGSPLPNPGLPKPSGGGGERVPTTGETAESVHETTTPSRRLGSTDRFAGESGRERHGWSGPSGSPGGGVQLGVSVGGFPLGGCVRVRSSRVGVARSGLVRVGAAQVRDGNGAG
jgi:hypothetical protein